MGIIPTMAADFYPRCRFCQRKMGTDYNKAVLEFHKKEVIT